MSKAAEFDALLAEVERLRGVVFIKAGRVALLEEEVERLKASVEESERTVAFLRGHLADIDALLNGKEEQQ